MTMRLANPNAEVLNTDVKLHRYWNFRGLIAATSNADAAGMLKKKTSYITAIAGPNPTRAIGDDMTADIERIYHLEPGSMDAPPDRRVSNDDTIIRDVAAMMSVANELDKILIEKITRTIVGHSIQIVSEMNKMAEGGTINGKSIIERLKTYDTEDIDDSGK